MRNEKLASGTNQTTGAAGRDLAKPIVIPIQLAQAASGRPARPIWRNSKCKRVLGRNGLLTEVVELDGGREGLTDQDLDRFIASFPVDVVYADREEGRLRTDFNPPKLYLNRHMVSNPMGGDASYVDFKRAVDFALKEATAPPLR